MFVSLDICIDEASEGLLERSQIPILSLSKKEQLEVKHGTFCWIMGQCSYITGLLLYYADYGYSCLVDEWYRAKDWAQIWLGVLAVEINIFRDFMLLCELQYLEPAFKGWQLLKVILFRKDAFNVHES